MEGLVEGTLTGGMPKATEGVVERGLRVGRAGGVSLSYTVRGHRGEAARGTRIWLIIKFADPSGSCVSLNPVSSRDSAKPFSSMKTALLYKLLEKYGCGKVRWTLCFGPNYPFIAIRLYRSTWVML